MLDIDSLMFYLHNNIWSLITSDTISEVLTGKVLSCDDLGSGRTYKSCNELALVNKFFSVRYAGS